MAVVRRERVIVNDVYKQTIQTKDWSSSDIQLIAQFGEPSVELGGHFDDGAGLTFDLPPNPRRIKTGLPYTQQFDGSADVDAKAKCVFWGTECETRIATAITNLRNNIDDFTGVDETTY